MNNNFRKYFGEPVECDGKIISCIDVLYDLPGDKGKIVSLHPNLSDEKCDIFINFCKKNGFCWERGAKRFYVNKNLFPILRDNIFPETGIELAYGLGVINDF